MSRNIFIPLKNDRAFPKSKEQRIALLKEVVTTVPLEKGRRIPGLGSQPFEIFEVDIDDLVYNFQNYRFFLERATYEKQHGESFYTDESNRFDAARITEEKIWQQDEEQNEKTINSLLQNGQIEPAVCDQSGVVVSGNRRLSLLQQIKRRREESYYKNSGIDQNRFNELGKIRVVVLPRILSDEEIESYETKLQHNEAGKLDYDRTAKYFIVRNLLRNHHKSQQVIFDENKDMPSLNNLKDVDKFVRVADLMDDYLKFIKHPEIYTLLEGTEDPMRKLDDDLRIIAEGKTNRIGNRDSMAAEYKATYFSALFAAKQSNKDSGGPGEKWYRSMLTAFDNQLPSWRDLRSKSLQSSTSLAIPQKMDDTSIKENIQDWNEKHGTIIATTVSDVVDDARDYKKFYEKPEKLLDKARDSLEQFEKMLSSEGSEEFLRSIPNVSGVIDDIREKVNAILNRLPVD